MVVLLGGSWPPVLQPVRWRVWTEWWSQEFADDPRAGAVCVSNFPVSAGRRGVASSVCAEQPDFGYVWISNFSTGQHTSVGIDALPQIASGSGGTVEWIVEAPSGSPDLPLFSPVTFNSCVGGYARRPAAQRLARKRGRYRRKQRKAYQDIDNV